MNTDKGKRVRIVIRGIKFPLFLLRTTDPDIFIRTGNRIMKTLKNNVKEVVLDVSLINPGKRSNLSTG